MRIILERLTSRKLVMAVLAAVVAFVKAYYPDFPDQALYAIVGALMGYVAIEGAVDAAAQLAKWAAEKRGMLGEHGNLEVRQPGTAGEDPGAAGGNPATQAPEPGVK